MSLQTIALQRGAANFTLGELLAGKPLLLVLLRHSGCPICREHLVVTEGILDQIRALGCELAGVCQGDGNDAQSLEQELELHFPVYGNADMALYRTLAMPRGSWWQVTLGPMLREPLKALKRMRDVRKPGRDVRQLGGVVLLSATGEVVYRYYQKDSADMPGDEQVMTAISEHLATA